MFFLRTPAKQLVYQIPPATNLRITIWFCKDITNRPSDEQIRKTGPEDRDCRQDSPHVRSPVLIRDFPGVLGFSIVA